MHAQQVAHVTGSGSSPSSIAYEQRKFKNLARRRKPQTMRGVPMGKDIQISVKGMSRPSVRRLIPMN
jgi:hypothetical protein